MLEDDVAGLDGQAAADERDARRRRGLSRDPGALVPNLDATPTEIDHAADFEHNEARALHLRLERFAKAAGARGIEVGDADDGRVIERSAEIFR